MTRKTLRAVTEDERPAEQVEQVEPLGLLDAIKAGDVLDMLLAQRRLIAEALVKAAENTRPQLNNELNKLHTLIREEQGRRAIDQQQEAEHRGPTADESWQAI